MATASSALTLQVEPYQIPQGKWDFPYAYVFNANSLTDGASYTDMLNVVFDGDSDFVLRHIVGIRNVLDTFANGAAWDFRNASRSYANGRPGVLIGPCNHWVVLPEKFYPYNGAIWFDLQKVLRATRVGTNYTSQLAWMGVKRYNLPAWCGDTKYAWRPLRFTYPYLLALNFAASAGPQIFYQSMEKYDFLLTDISINAVGAAGALSTDDFQIQLYDAWNHPTSNAPLNQAYINSGRIAAQTPPRYQPFFPTPALLYPAGSQIKFIIQSLLNVTTNSYNIHFNGIWRFPKP